MPDGICEGCPEGVLDGFEEGTRVVGVTVGEADGCPLGLPLVSELGCELVLE